MKISGSAASRRRSRPTCSAPFWPHRGARLPAPLWVHCGYEPLPAIDGLRTPVLDVGAPVDNVFRLGPTLGFETSPIIVTTGLRSSRFAAILFWEVLHALAVDGLWIDIDETRRSAKPAGGFEDFLQREYF